MSSKAQQRASSQEGRGLHVPPGSRDQKLRTTPFQSAPTSIGSRPTTRGCVSITAQLYLEILLEGRLVQLHEPLVLGRLVGRVSVEELPAHPFQGGLERRWDDVIHRQSHQLHMNTRENGGNRKKTKDFENIRTTGQ